jgi:hypothetical protein
MDFSFFRQWLSEHRRPVGLVILLLGLSGAVFAYRWFGGPDREVAQQVFAPGRLDLSRVDTAFPFELLAPKGAVAVRADEGLSLAPELLVRDSSAGFGVRISLNEFYDVSLDDVLRAEKERVKSQQPFVRFLREESSGFVYEQVWGDRAVYDFLYVAQRGDRFYYFQVDGLRPFTRQQVEGMYECVADQ